MKQGILWFICLFGIIPIGLFAQAAESRGIIQEVQGKVEIRALGADWIPAVEGQRVEWAATISTGFKGTALIKLGNSLLTVRPLTRLTVREIQETQGIERVSLDMQTGRIRADVTPPAGGKTDFTVRSPTVTASVRGTSFEFDGTILLVDEGRVRLTGGDSTSVYVSAGHHVTTDPVTGRILLVAETIREEMVPDKPVGMGATSPDVNIQPATASSVGPKWE
ncbi:FecR family protein [Treponema primitia]|uniref:FecR family protein n=1 Tax=Treponema primitia TaxID=88058 RepID=UPI003980E879